MSNLSQGAILWLLLGLFCWSIISHSNPMAQAVAVRTWPDQDYTRITIELDHAVSNWKQFFLENPKRLVLDLENVKLNPILQSLPFNITRQYPYIQRIHMGQLKPTVTRIVLTLKKNVRAQVFQLKPIKPYQNRFVIDLYPAEPKSELDWHVHSAPTEIFDIIDQVSQHYTNPLSGIAKSDAPYLIAIDPGHGGEDPGAVGKQGTKEKDITLQISQRLARLINLHPKMQAYLTRRTDYYIPLYQRIQRSRKAKADLFLSIHTDAFTNRSAQGASVFVLSSKGASSVHAKWLARKENQADLIGGTNLPTQKDKILATTLLDLSQTVSQKESYLLAHDLLESLSKITKLHSVHVQKANFAVLKAPDIPSVLIETAFISNLVEERKLKSSSHQKKLSQAIFNGIINYLKKHNPTLQP